MEYVGLIDIIVFLGLATVVIGIGLYQSRKATRVGGSEAADYFLAGRGLTWWLIGFSLIAANISTEQFVGMSGKAADWLGMAIASYEWMAAITLVVVAFVFLPKFLRSGIYTIPEFLEYRYNAFARLVMAIATLIILVGVPTASVIYSGAKVITGNFQGLVVFGNIDFGDITLACWIIGSVAALYVFLGGLKACAWTDLMWGSGLILGGVIIAYMAFKLLGETAPDELIVTAANSSVSADQLASSGWWERFTQLNRGPLPDGKLHMIREVDDPELPWSALIVGLWIPHFFYWGLNQYITQRTLGSKSLAEGQRGIVFAAFLKLIIPFVVVIPGILAFNLFHEQLQKDAINRNARLLSIQAPELYKSLSESMKPEDVARNTTILGEIEKNLAWETSPGDSVVYLFDPDFVELHPADAALVLAHNRAVVESHTDSVAEIDADEADLTTINDALLGRLGGDSAKTVGQSKLVTHDFDNAFPTLIRELLPVNIGIKGFVLVAIFGAVVSSLASMLNSASTIATMDIYRKIRPAAPQTELVTAGRVFVILFVLVAMLIAPSLGDPRFGGIFTFIQEFQGFISPGILAIFLFGLLVHRAPRYVGTIGLLLNPLLYGLFKYSPVLFGDANPVILEWLADRSFLDRMAICFGIVLTVLTISTIVHPLRKPVELPVNPAMDMTHSATAKSVGVVVVLLTILLYIVFW